MFTGITTATAPIKKITADKKGGLFFVITKPKKWNLKKGESIMINGVCGTVTASSNTFSCTFMPETLQRSTVGTLTVGQLVNLEKALRFGDRLGGHIVQGHVDTVGSIIAVAPEGNSFIFKIIPTDKKIMRFIAKKGSVAIDGISLTVVEVSKTYFTVKIIPFTWQHTNVSTKRAGSKVNIEADALAKYKFSVIKKLISK